jgi:glycosyltransferase involved in cell wall biosynthesis
MMLRGASIVCLSSIDWSFNRQNPQEVSLAFAERRNRVFFVENTGVRAPTLRDAARLWSRLLHWWRARGGVRSVAPGIDVLSPVLLPFPYSRLAVRLNTGILLRSLRAWLGDDGGPLIVITFLPTPLAREVIAALDPALVVYYCIDRFAESSVSARRVADSERKLFAEAGLVLVTSDVLYELAAAVSSNVSVIASGVRAREFEGARRARAETHTAFADRSGPIVGYVGSVRSSTDLALLSSAATLAPDLQFVIVGPRFVDVTALAAHPNVRLLDAIPPEDVMNYMVRFDVGILPYSLDEFTAAIMPVKFKEYLAAGLPVVATALPEVRRFAEQQPGLVRFAGNPQEFVAALRAALSDVAPEAVQRRLAAARQYEWSAQTARIIELMENALAERASAAGL